MRSPALASAAALAALSAPAPAQCLEDGRLAASNAQTAQEAGCAVAVDGDRALLGVRSASPGGLTWAGAVVVFELHGGQWVETAQLVASDATPQAHFGAAVALEGGRAVIGAYRDPHAGLPGVGSAYVFELQGGTWTQVDKVLASDAAADALFGASVALSGDRFVVGAPQAGLAGEDWVGAAYVFRAGSGGWSEEQKLVPSSASALDLIGRSVALDGERALVGAYGEDQGALFGVGAAFVFDFDGATWSESAALFASDAAPYERLGFAVALRGDRALCGAPKRATGGAIGAGAAYVFERVGAGWLETAILEAPTPLPGDGLGWALALEGDTAVLASPTADGAGGGIDVGTARVFTRDAGGWSQTGVLAASDPQAGDRLGWAVDVTSGRVLLGAITGDAPGAADSGSALVFGLPPCAGAYCACDTTAPCGNLDPTAGCANSTGSGARLAVTGGSASVAADDLVLGASNVLPNQPGLFFQGDQAVNGGAGIPFGDGLRCAGGNVIRLQTTTPGPGGTTQTSISIGTRGNVAPGDVKRYQYWYRDPQGSPCGNLFNLTNALELAWLP